MAVMSGRLGGGFVAAQPTAQREVFMNRPDHFCGVTSCSIDWLLDPVGPGDPAWRTRVGAEAQADPNYVRWKERKVS